MRLIYLALGWVLGIYLEYTIPTLPHSIWFYAVVISLILLLLLRHWQYHAMLFIVFAIVLGGYRTSWVPTSADIARYNGNNVAIEGIVIDAPDLRDTQTQIRVAVDTVFDGRNEYYSEGIVLVVLPRRISPAYGDKIRVSGALYEPGVYDRFSYADYLAREGIFSIMQDASMEIIDSGYGSPIYEQLYALRQQAQLFIEQALPSPQSALLTGILLGNERHIDTALADDFAAVGAAHIIAISGFNMAIIGSIIIKLLQRMTEAKWVSISGAVVIITLYTMLVGANAAVVRAAIMTIVVLIGTSLDRRTFLPASLAFVVMIMSMGNPLILWDVGFQLSFAAVLGIAIFATPIARTSDIILARLFPQQTSRYMSALLAEPLVISIATLITTLPLSILYFERLSPVVLMVNLLIVPVQGYLLIVGGIATLIAFISPALAQIIYWIDMVFLSWTIGVIRRFADIPFASVEITMDDRLIFLFFITIIGGTMVYATRPPWVYRLTQFIQQRLIVNALIFVGTMIGILLLAITISRPDGFLHIRVLDVGHTNAIFIQSPDGTQILIDGGQYPARLLTAIGDVMPFYDRTIEVIALTQTDVFDISAVESVLARYDAGLVLTTGQANLDIDESRLGDYLREANTISVTTGYTLELGEGVQLEVLAPFEAPDIIDAINDSVMVLRLTYGDMAVLFLSDASITLQEALLANGIDISANIVQLPQNGTARSLSAGFFDVIQPQLAWLQVDGANRRGDPASDVLAILDEYSNTSLLSTEEKGALHLWTDGSTLWVESD